MKTLLFILVIYSFKSFAFSDCNQLMQPFFKEFRIEKSKSNDIDITKFGLEENSMNRTKFERLYAQCMSPNKNQIKLLAQNEVNKTFQVMSLATTIVGYTETNWQKPKDLEWFGRLGYTLTFGAICGQLYSKIIKDDGNKFQFLIKDYLFGRITLLSWAYGDNYIFGPEKKIKDKLENLKSSPHFTSDIQKLKKYVGNDEIFERFKHDVLVNLSHLEEINLGLGIHQGVDFDHLSPKDLNDPDIAKIVFAAILAQEYETSSKGIITLGTSNLDAFAYDSMYSILKIPKDIFVHKMTNQIMCLNLHNTNRGLVQVIGINTLNQILFADYYGITYRALKQELTSTPK